MDGPAGMQATARKSPPPSRSLPAVLGRRSIAGQVLILQVVVVVIVAAAAGTALVLIARHTASRSTADRVLAVAETFAEAPGVEAALAAPDPSAELQPTAERVRRRSGVDFLVVMNVHGFRYTHPNPTLIGKHFIGHIEPALRGHELTETFTGTLGPSVRAVVPVLGADGSVRGLVAAGITLRAVDASVTRQLLVVGSASFAVVVLTLSGAVLLSRRVRRQTHGLGSADLARMHEHHDTVLHAVREGVLIIDDSRQLLLANDEARRLLGLPAGGEGRSVDEVGLDPAVAGLFGSGRLVDDAVLPVGDRLVAVNQRPTEHHDRATGSVVTLRDTTELRALTGELDAVRGFAAALRAQAHEAANRMHTVVTLVQLQRYAQAVSFATAGLEGAQQLTDQLLAAVDEPVLAALLLGKVAQAHERGVELVVTEDTRFESFGIDAADLVTVVGNLIDNAVDAALADGPAGRPARRPRRVTVAVQADREACLVRVTDTGPGLTPDQIDDAFRLGWTTKSDPAGPVPGRGIGLALVRQVVRRHAGSVTVRRDGETAGRDGETVERDGETVFTVRLPARPATCSERGA
ncbi:sensor histidine kinase [Frankia sp. AiPs1]|uniref:ATP-binding protein n=1 Tax=Frankia sp. AiPs1 TaxID=573493 RepID=UPI0020441FA0|nr:sensor histidine kinase [Frankia sp. AiPs1]MCM3923139.1 sensor histidine kinase [Frankia sp. AiPs1]